MEAFYSTDYSSEWMYKTPYDRAALYSFKKKDPYIIGGVTFLFAFRHPFLEHSLDCISTATQSIEPELKIMFPTLKGLSFELIRIKIG